MVALHDLYWNFLFSCQMICKQYIVLNHMFLNLLQQCQQVYVLKLDDPFLLFKS